MGFFYCTGKRHTQECAGKGREGQEDSGKMTGTWRDDRRKTTRAKYTRWKNEKRNGSWFGKQVMKRRGNKRGKKRMWRTKEAFALAVLTPVSMCGSTVSSHDVIRQE